MTKRRAVVVGILVIVLIPPVILAIFLARFDPNRYAPALIAAVDASTGRRLTLGAPIKMSLSRTLKIVADNVSLSNPPGFTDANLLVLNRVEAQIALLPLLWHQIDIVRIVLIRPVISLEFSKTGRADWDLASPAVPGASSIAQGDAGAGKNKIALEAVEIQNGSVSVSDEARSASVTIGVDDLRGTANSASAPLTISANAAFNGVPFTLHGIVGPIERFSGVGSGPWPVSLMIAADGATMSVQGSIGEPRRFSGYDLAVGINIPALEALASDLSVAMTKKITLPPIHGITGSAEILDQNAIMPAINHLSIRAGASDLSALRPALSLTALDLEMATLDDPISIRATGSIAAMPLSLNGTFGAASSLVSRSWLPRPATGSPANFPVSLQVQAGGAKFGLSGGMATPQTLAGAALNVSVSIPDLSALGSLAGTALPAWQSIMAQGILIDPGGLGLGKAIGIDGLVLKMDHAALGGEASLYFGAPPRLQAAVEAQRIDLDPLLAALPAGPSTPSGPASTPTRANLLVPPVNLPLATLRSGTADVQISANTITLNGAAYTALQSHAVLSGAVLILSPLTAVLPGGGISASAVLDATKDPADATVTINAPALALSPFLNALGLSDMAAGTLQAQLNASGNGDTLQDIAGSVTGRLGLAMVNGVVDGAVLSRLFGAVLQAVDLPVSLIGAQGPVAVRCLGLRVDANDGIGTISALTLDSSRLLIQGGGSMNFGNETLGVIIRPQLRVAGAALGVPVKLGGSFADPAISVAPLAAVQEAAQSAAGLTINLAQEVPGGATLIGNIENRLGLGGTPDVCPAALALGRLGNPGPDPAPPYATLPGKNSAEGPAEGPKSLLNALFGK